MYSLFTKIFLSFWLAALLLGAAMFAAEHFLGDGAIKQAVEQVDAHADTVSALLAEEGMPAVRRWLAGMSRHERMPLLLLDARGQPLGNQPFAHRLREHLQQTLELGVHPLRPGLIAVVRPVPNTEPPLHLAAMVRLDQRRYLSTAARFGLAVVVSGLVSFGLATIITRPVRRLRRAAQALAEGDLTARVPARGRDEVAALARDFNLMADRVRDLLESQRRLLRDVSHELRSPLARLRVAVELARKKEDTQTLLARIEREADRLEGLVSDVLSVARLEAGQTQLQRERVHLDELLAAIAQDAAFEAEAAGKRVTWRGPVPVAVDGDPVLLRAAIENVVRNAVRHTAPDTVVTITLGTEQDHARVEICDRGPGVPEAELGKLFRPFTRVGEARERASGGFGLGLAISRQTAEAHGGRIAAANAAEGGLCVTLWFPLPRA